MDYPKKLLRMCQEQTVESWEKHDVGTDRCWRGGRCRCGELGFTSLLQIGLKPNCWGWRIWEQTFFMAGVQRVTGVAQMSAMREKVFSKGNRWNQMHWMWSWTKAAGPNIKRTRRSSWLGSNRIFKGAVSIIQNLLRPNNSYKLYKIWADDHLEFYIWVLYQTDPMYMTNFLLSPGFNK